MIYFNLFVFSWKDEDPDWQVMLIWPVKDPQHAEQKLIKNQVYAKLMLVFLTPYVKFEVEINVGRIFIGGK